MKGPLIILSGPSGSGKSTLVQRLLATSDLPLRLSVSATTRPPRPGEVDGAHYHFWTRERFDQEVAAGAFLEWALVHGRDCYGTLIREVEPYRGQGMGVVLDIDVQGAEQVRRRYPGNHVSIFLRAASLEEYERRLIARGTESPEAIARRLETARRELAGAGAYDHQVVNDVLERAVAEVEAIVREQFKGGRECSMN
jgi:guanylate kinase